MHNEGALPPVTVVRAFGASVHLTPVPLAGGLQQTAWRVGDLVLKPIEEANPGEGDWVAAVLDAMVGEGFRVIRPVRAADGEWLYRGWTAWHWLDGDHAKGDWRAVVRAADAFHAELARAAIRVGHRDRPSWLDARHHRWARAESTIWHGADLPPTITTGAFEWSMYERAVALGPPLNPAETIRCQVVHGDIAGNVLIDASGTPGFIDMSPGWRPPGSASSQALVEAVAWFGADESLLDDIDPADSARACGFRFLCGLQSVEDWMAVIPDEVASWARVLNRIGA